LRFNLILDSRFRGNDNYAKPFLFHYAGSLFPFPFPSVIFILLLPFLFPIVSPVPFCQSCSLLSFLFPSVIPAKAGIQIDHVNVMRGNMMRITRSINR
jgi:hypothetical protein